MQAFFGVTAPTVHQMVLQLERHRLIRRTPRAARSPRLAPTPRAPLTRPAEATRNELQASRTSSFEVEAIYVGNLAQTKPGVT
jgi:hypothetical protein